MSATNRACLNPWRVSMRGFVVWYLPTVMAKGEAKSRVPTFFTGDVRATIFTVCLAPIIIIEPFGMILRKVLVPRTRQIKIIAKCIYKLNSSDIFLGTILTSISADKAQNL